MITEEFFSKYQQNLLQGQQNSCRKMVEKLLENNISIKSLYVDLFQRSMYQVGSMWEKNQMSVAHEHLCTSITQNLISQVYPRLLALPHHGRKVVVSCTPGEMHQLGARMVADFLEINGWDSHFLGFGTPPMELIRFIGSTQPQMIALSMSIFSNISTLKLLVQKINETNPGIRILLGGQGFRWGGTEMFVTMQDVNVVHGLDFLENI